MIFTTLSDSVHEDTSTSSQFNNKLHVKWQFLRTPAHVHIIILTSKKGNLFIMIFMTLSDPVDEHTAHVNSLLLKVTNEYDKTECSVKR